MLLLTRGNEKLTKTEKQQKMYQVISLSCESNPKKKMCPFSSPACRDTCFSKHGRFVFHAVKRTLSYKTKQWLHMKNQFVNALIEDIKEANHKSKGKEKQLCVRLGITHDAIGCGMYNWESGNKRIYDLFPDVIFYEYTKAPLKWRKKHNICGKNLHIVFSRTETNEASCIEELKELGKVAVIFEEVPKVFSLGEKQFNVVDGDSHDLHFLHPAGCIVGLKAKGPYILKDQTGLLIKKNN
jgi:hypothetical protein